MYDMLVTGFVSDTEDNWNVLLKECTCTKPDGKIGVLYMYFFPILTNVLLLSSTRCSVY